MRDKILYISPMVFRHSQVIFQIGSGTTPTDAVFTSGAFKLDWTNQILQRVGDALDLLHQSALSSAQVQHLPVRGTHLPKRQN